MFDPRAALSSKSSSGSSLVLPTAKKVRPPQVSDATEVIQSVGPCCGYVSYYDCTDDVALGLQDTFGAHIYEVYNRQMSNIGNDSSVGTMVDEPTVITDPTIGATTGHNASYNNYHYHHNQPFRRI